MSLWTRTNGSVSPTTTTTTTTSSGVGMQLLITQTVGGKPYALRASPPVPWIRTVGKAAVQILALPLMLPAGLAMSAIMATPLRDAVLGVMIPIVMKAVEREFRQERLALLDGVSGNVLDVGSGAGAYLAHCKAADHVVALEPNEALHSKILDAGKDLKSLAVVKDFDAILEGNDAKEEGPASTPPPPSFDWVIFGNVLCEVECVHETMRRVDSLLKPGGRVYFSEHVARPKGTWRRAFQDAVNPMWRHVGGGCNCNRDSIEIMRQMTNWDVAAWTYEHVQVNMGPFVMGLAAKPSLGDGDGATV